MSTLVGFLLARIAEDEGNQKHRVGNDWHTFDCDATTWAAECFGTCDCGIPDRVLAECEAKRQIIKEHETIRAAYPGTTIETDPCCTTCSAGGEYPGHFPCPTLRLLALPYADHSDYRDGWRP